MPKNYFDEPIARTYEAKWPELFDPAAIDPVVAFLADLAVDHPVVVGDRDLGGDVVLLEAEVRRGHGEGMDGLAWREPL